MPSIDLDCDFAEDPRIKQLSEKWGVEVACSFWTLLMCFVRKHSSPDSCMVKVGPAAECSDLHLAKCLHSKPNVVWKRLELAAEIGLISREDWRNDRVISIPKMVRRLRKVVLDAPNVQNDAGRPPSLSTTVSMEKGKEEETRPPGRTLFEVYNAERGGLPEAQEFTDSRRKKCEARFRLRPTVADLSAFIEKFKSAVIRARSSPFMAGDNSRHWKVTFDWFVENENNIVKVLEGKYDAPGTASLFGGDNGTGTTSRNGDRNAKSAAASNGRADGYPDYTPKQ